jgi:Ca2+-transporting ATPase
LIAAETLGSSSVICADKTGTLTEGKMEIAQVSTRPELHELALKIAAFCSEAFIENLDHPMEKWIVRGRPTDRALLFGAIQAGVNIKELQEREPKIDEIPFDSLHKYSASLHQLESDKKVIYLMGAPETILKKSSVPKNIKEFQTRSDDLALKGYRVVALAYKEIRGHKEKISHEDLKEMNFIGFIALHDPLRKRAKKAIEICRKAGMRPIIVTGDHKLTALAIAKKVGFEVSENNILEGEHLEKLSDEEFKKIFKDIQIYARVSPEQKLRIIDVWQQEGEVVAMTGDGVNDAPALKKANIGVALGSGTEVAKEAADLVLLTDDFEIILVAVEEGRRIIDNIRKIITYLLTGGFTELMLIGAAIIAHLPLPVLPSQILWKNLIESTPPSIALTFEPKEKGIMLRKPEAAHLPILTTKMKVFIFIVGILTNLLLFAIFWWFLRHSDYGQAKIALIRSVMFAGLAIDSFFFIFSFRNLRLNI